MPPSTTSADARRPLGGRPRDPQIDDAILTAVRDLLAEDGYARLSFETVARRAGVTRPTIYRRWPSKAHLVHQAVFPARDADVLIPDTGDFAADVRRMIGDTVASYERPEARAALPGLLTDLHQDPGLRAAVIDGLENRVRGQFRALLEAAVARGAVRAEVDPEVLFDAVLGAVFTRAVRGVTMPGAFVDALTALVVDGAAPRP
ncbi:TetR/AcrR family transcriptional regulator [Yinghuangia seranimata]|uniref:TetR/AcrR family transcriptional regulator n=1 Tax=Yinghuangia seranimata TaxID=408067 RepID=UPI00248CBB33|nr:TetR/AcrR family transcriptional regulator [Yinghuangia seranimata]MDI2125897.1 TetR/AcrR family transcriptional regulator [Yinghuangia seranimata]